MFSSFTAAFSFLVLAALPAVRGATHEVVVGGTGILKYTPESVDAASGDTVRFVFKQKNHTATQSTFANPCVKAPGGFDSGFVPVADDVTDGFQVAEFSVTSTDPVWVYCKQGTHCSSAGMVFAINPGEKMAAFKAAATGAAPASTASTPSTSTTAAPTSSTTATSTTPQQIKVVVGGTGVLAFTPSNIQANVGDTILFEFHQKNHSVVASSFDAPCVALSQSVAGQAGFNSGYFPVADGATTFPTFSVVVNDTKPIWAYCPQANHCGQGMVFSVNAVEGGSKSFSAFQEQAKTINGTAATTTGSGYGSGAVSTTISGASAAVAALLAIAALL